MLHNRWQDTTDLVTGERHLRLLSLSYCTLTSVFLLVNNISSVYQQLAIAAVANHTAH